MRLLKIFIQNMPRFKGDIDIDFITKQRVAEDDKEKLFHVFSNSKTSIYTNQAISFIGLNASGKTTILKAISFVINLLNNEALNNIKSKEILNDLSEGEKVKIISFFYNDNSIYKLETIIAKKINQVDNEEKLIITEERLWEKDANKVKTKKNIFDFNDSNIRIERNEKEQFLLNDVSVMVIMVDSNIQREELLISEKAFAYKMKYEALKRQGKRSDLTSCQVGKKLAAEEVSQNTGDSSRQILRYIHLTELITELLELADEKKLPFNTAVEVSYLRSEEQQILLQYMSNHNMVPSMKQAKELKQISKERMLTYSEIDQICMNESTEKVQVQIPAKKLKQYFPESYSKAQIEEVIFMLLASWAEKQ